MNVPRERPGMLYILVGPGGVGKNVLLNDAVSHFQNLAQLPTATTRPRRSDEQHGRERLFVTEAEFQRMIDEDKLIEHQEVHPGQFYGVPREVVEQAIAEGRDLIADIEYKGADIIRRQYPRNSITIFIAPPSMDTLRQRMEQRASSKQDISDRLQRSIEEMPYAPVCDYLLVNDDIDSAKAELRAFIRAQRGEADLSAAGYPLNRVQYEVELWPVHGGEALLRAAVPDLPLRLMLGQGDDPTRHILDYLSRALPLVAVADALHYGLPDDEGTPVAVAHDRGAHSYRVTLRYTYRMPQRFDPPAGWVWRDYRRAAMSEDESEVEQKQQ